MIGTGALDELISLSVSQGWRLVLLGDPRQLQAVGRGGMFDELCRVGRTHELATIHRFHARWERAASLKLRSGHTDAIDAYFDHDRVTPGTFDQLATEAARQWVEHHTAHRTVAVLAETNEHVDALNLVIQQRRRALGHLGDRAVRVAGGETAAVGDIVVTRRNDRALRTDRGEPLRNRDRWTVTDVGYDGSLTVSHLHGQGRVTIPPDYARDHVRLGYAATAHGHQGDTVDIGITIVTEATTHRSLYVGATRGRLENRLLVVTDDPSEARDVLERVLISDRADVPAVAQRRNLSRQKPTTRSAEDAIASARDGLTDARRRAEPFLDPVRNAEHDVLLAEQHLRGTQRKRADAPLWRRHRFSDTIARATTAVADARNRLAEGERIAAPYVGDIHAAQLHLDQVERDATVARVSERLSHLARQVPARTVERGLGIER